jgi:hypothetical protein
MQPASPPPDRSRMRRLSPAGVAAALLHVALLALTVALILGTRSGDWRSYWILFLALDFPVSLGVIPVSGLVPRSEAGPLSDVSNFWWPLAYHGVVGTWWWYVVGWAIARRIAGPRESATDKGRGGFE